MKLKYFNACVSAVVCFGGGHRTLYKTQLYALEVLFPKLCRSIATTPSDTDWSLEWHQVIFRVLHCDARQGRKHGFAPFSAAINTATFFCRCKVLPAIWMYSVIRGMLRWQTSHHPQSTFRASRRSFPKVMQINCGGFAPYKLDQSTSINAIFRAKNFEPLCGESRVESHPLAQRQPLKGARKQQQLL